MRRLAIFLMMCIVAVSGVVFASWDYRAGQGDVLDVRVFGEEDLSGTFTVSSEGYIAFPLVKLVKVGGLTTIEIGDRLTKLLAKDYLVNPQVTVHVKEFVSRKVQVHGAVKTPGTFSLRGSASVSEIIAMAGGMLENGRDTLILVRPPDPETGERVTLRIGLGAVVNGKDSASNVEVFGGEILFVPRADEVFVMGEVTQPGSVLYTEGMSLLQAISKVRGFKETAATTRIQIIRRIDGKQKSLRVDGRKIQDGEAQDVPLLPEDLITVPKSIF